MKYDYEFEVDLKNGGKGTVKLTERCRCVLDMNNEEGMPVPGCESCDGGGYELTRNGRELVGFMKGVMFGDEE